MEAKKYHSVGSIQIAGCAHAKQNPSPYWLGPVVFVFGLAVLNRKLIRILHVVVTVRIA